MGNHQSENEISVLSVSQKSCTTSKFHHNREFMAECIGDNFAQMPMKERKNSEIITTRDALPHFSKGKTAGVKNANRRCSIPAILWRIDAKFSAGKKEDDAVDKIYPQKKALHSTKYLHPRHRSSMAILERPTPIIQITEVDDKNMSKTENDLTDADDKIKVNDTVQKQRAQKMDSRKVTAQRRLERSSQQSQKRRLEYLAGTATNVARSLDEASGSHTHFATDLQRAMMKPLSVCHRNSPLKQMRTYSHRSMTSEENLLTKEDGEEIRASWKLVNERIHRFNSDRCFGFYVLEKVLEKAPKLKSIFNISNISIYDIPDTHTFSRHTRIFNSIIDLAVRNVDELETEIAPALFIYGRRHYQPLLLKAFNEESVRTFCEEIVHTMLDFLGDNLTTAAFEAWIELVRYMGTVLLSGFEYERLAATKKISINTRQHSYFVL